MVADSIPDEVNGLFNWRNNSSRIMVLESTRPLIPSSTRNLTDGKGRPSRKANSFTALSRLSRKCGSLDVSQPVTRAALSVLIMLDKTKQQFHTFLGYSSRWAVKLRILCSTIFFDCAVELKKSTPPYDDHGSKDKHVLSMPSSLAALPSELLECIEYRIRYQTWPSL
jgi:hypothetical protein